MFIGSDAPDQSGRTQQYKRNTEPLSHIQLHTGFKCYLVLFQEFNKEPCYKDQHAQKADQQPLAMLPLFSPVKAVEQKKIKR